MDIVYTLGISSLWDEVCHMPVGGVWWLNVDRYADAVSLMNQTLESQAQDSKVAAIVMGKNPKEVMSLKKDRGPNKIALFTMPDRPEGLKELHRDLLCSVDPGNYLFILLCTENSWQNIKTEELLHWVEKSNRWAKYHNCSLMILNSANDTDKQLSPLLRQYRALSGLASIRYQGDSHLFDIAWWGSEKGISAQQQLVILHDDEGWRLAQNEEAVVQPRSDEKIVLSNLRVLEGAPALSEYWTLFETNDAVFEAGRTAQAATLLFSITQNEQIEQLGRYIHTLRRQRGSALKIVVREQTPSLRATDERLLLSSGANMVIPCSAGLSRCLTLIESVQKQKFTRHVPEDFNTLLTWSRPLKLRGYQKWDAFCEAVGNIMANTLLPPDSKGVMVALRPAPGLRVEQALTLCKPNRMGDIVTIGNNRLVLFLSFCRVNDLDTALNHIFPLPTGDIFSNRMIWFEDKQISAEILLMRGLSPDNWNTPLPITIGKNEALNVKHDGRQWRRIPEPWRLSTDGEPRS
ncbi:TPA: cellulose biosynthesis protein BcsE [Klebsiella aerogenes]|uniref:Cellulose biosynthesis protein BcsE n=1 Tax=Klebsiella aerogenes TaxID=548 RepID=A0AAW9E0U8_KLEAE|nr:cellulose biosynthesis protein BcsE [Klebsiella aerogenes]AMQ60248.1 cellulose biosynthesis protein BcsE [Klebsiella aerogenes]ATY00271.1 cellulose biosynthesis protein BcsE [Klebsiella aerogenes]ATY05271.1 cellulose biosynthesis protein BcsE [Klebsiella aerogenes]AVE38638.1 cellulose biosynthesis protein BcsE [Klebsiella aerogenes]AVE98136.1 cellulose biosynthesis protein BcsE [Klebsiella aerogenes]